MDPEELIPKLPKPRDLQPFPTTESIVSPASEASRPARVVGECVLLSLSRCTRATQAWSGVCTLSLLDSGWLQVQYNIHVWYIMYIYIYVKYMYVEAAARCPVCNHGNLPAGSDDGTVRVWEVVTGRCVKTLPLPSPPHSISFSPSHTLTLMAIAA